MEFHPFLEKGIIPRNSIWYVLSAAGDAPALRVGHACVHIGATTTSNGQLYVVGGANPSGTFADVYSLDLDNFMWSKHDSMGFAGRYEHTAFVCNADQSRIYVFGGADGAGNRNDVQVFSTVDNSWSSVETSGTPPPSRTFHNGSCVNGQLIVYGGGDRGAEPVTDRKVHVFDSTACRWSVLDVRGDAPKPRHGHVMAAVGERVFFHGGMAGTNFYDDLHILDLNKNAWFHAKIKTTKPSGRAAHGHFVIGSCLYIFGGMNQNGALDDMFKLDTNVMEWTKLELKGPPPTNRLDFACCTIKLSIPILSTADSVQSVSSMDKNSADDQSELKIVSSGTQNPDAQKLANIVELDLVPNAPQESVCQVENLSQIEKVSSDSSSAKSGRDDANDLTAPLSACRLVQEHTAQCPADDKQYAALREGIPASGTEDRVVELAVILGGMDTNGEIFDDCMVMRP